MIEVFFLLSNLTVYLRHLHFLLLPSLCECFQSSLKRQIVPPHPGRSRYIFLECMFKKGNKIEITRHE